MCGSAKYSAGKVLNREEGVSVQGGQGVQYCCSGWVGVWRAVHGEESGKMRWGHILMSLQCHAGSLNHSAMIHTHAERRELILETLRPKCILLIEELMANFSLLKSPAVANFPTLNIDSW